jgi:hypothetical protein
MAFAYKFDLLQKYKNCIQFFKYYHLITTLDILTILHLLQYSAIKFSFLDKN